MSSWGDSCFVTLISRCTSNQSARFRTILIRFYCCRLYRGEARGVLVFLCSWTAFRIGLFLLTAVRLYVCKCKYMHGTVRVLEPRTVGVPNFLDVDWSFWNGALPTKYPVETTFTSAFVVLKAWLEFKWLFECLYCKKSWLILSSNLMEFIVIYC